MADQPTTPSGSRWEPDPDQPAAQPADGSAVPLDAPTASTTPYGAVPSVPAPDPGPALDPAAEARRTQLRGRAVLAGAATALVLGGGLTGFVIGHSTAGHDTVGFQPAGFDGQGGQQGPPSFQGDGDRDGDQDGDGFGPPQGPNGGGSSSSGSSSGSTSGGTSGTSSTGT